MSQGMQQHTPVIGYGAIVLILTGLIYSMLLGLRKERRDLDQKAVIAIEPMKERVANGDSVIDGGGNEWFVIKIEGCQFLQRDVRTSYGCRVPITIHRPSCPNHDKGE